VAYTRVDMPKPIPPRTLLLVIILAAITVPLTWKAKSLERHLFGPFQHSAMLHKPAPDFQLETLRGQSVSLSEFRGKKIVVSFWASWCGPCRMELPELQAFYEKYHPQEKNFEVLAISTDEKLREAQKYVDEAKLTFPVLWDADGKAQDGYKVEGIPMLFVIDENGTIVYTQDGYGFGLELKLCNLLGIKNASPTELSHGRSGD
jgi:peroxiredoxin